MRESDQNLKKDNQDKPKGRKRRAWLEDEGYDLELILGKEEVSLIKKFRQMNKEEKRNLFEYLKLY